MKIFALQATHSFGSAVASELGLPLAALEEREFEDGEHKARPLESVRGEDCFVIQSLYAEPNNSVHDKLCRLLFFLAALRENDAARVVAAVPYLAYGRKDRQTKSRDPVTTRYMAQLFEAVGSELVITLEVHNLVAFQNAFRCRTLHLEPSRLYTAQVARLVGEEPLVVVSPDPGGVKRAQLFRETLEAELGRPIDNAFLEKRRSGGVVSGHHFAGEVAGATALVIDDLVSTGSTLARAAAACREKGAKQVFAFAAHGLFVGEAARVLAEPALERLFITDSVPPFRLPPALLEGKVEIISAVPLVADAIRRCGLRSVGA